MNKLKIFFILVLTLTLLFINIAEAQIAIDCSSNNCSFSITSQYSTPSSMCEERRIDVSVLDCIINVTFYSMFNQYSLCRPTFYVERSGDYVVLSRAESGSSAVYLNYVLCLSNFCRLDIQCNGCTTYGSLDLMPPNCQGGSGGGSGDNGDGGGCSWWDIPCHLRSIFSWIVNSITGLLQGFFSWIAEQIMNALPQPIKDFFNFMGQLFSFLGQLISQIINYLPYFLFTLGLIFSFGLIYYVAEYGVVGIGMYFEMIYDLFRKFIELIIKVIDSIIPF